MKKLQRHPESHSLAYKIGVPAGLVLLILAGLVIWLGFFTDACRIRKVIVTGNAKLTTERARGESGVDSYRNLITLPVGRLEKNLEADPWIKEARISRGLLHTVRISVTERKPVALLDFKESGFIVDGGGYVIARVASNDFVELPRIHGGDSRVPSPGRTLNTGKIREAVSVLDTLPEDIRASVLLVNPFDGRGQVFISRAGYQVVYGTAENRQKKNDVLEVLVLDIAKNNRKIAYVDVRVPDSPVVKSL